MLRIAQGRVYDPANGIDGEVRDVCLDGGRVVEELPSHAPHIDARGMVVMPGGVDIHSHIAGPAVNAARKLAPEEHRGDVIDRTALTRSGTGGTVPSTFATGYRYALLGYTTVVDAATPPLAARHTLAELRDTPIVDKAFLVLMGNNLSLFELIREGGPVTEAVAWWLEATGGYGVKLVNPGGVEMWKNGNRNVTSLDDEVEALGVTPRRVLEAIATAVDELGLPHPVHVHCNNLGVAGNWRTTLDTLDTLQGRRAHLAHLQFHAYGGTPGKRPRSRAPELAEHLAAHPEHSADIGQVMFGPATTMTADAPVSALLRDITGGKWLNADLEAETGCGIVPFAYRERTLGEIAIITRAGPARLLGLADKGHLGVGADADVTVYAEHEDREQMFATPRYVIKGGRVIVEDGELRETPAGDLLRAAADHDQEIERTLRPLFEEHYSVRLANYPVREPWLLEPARTISAQRAGSGP